MDMRKDHWGKPLRSGETGSNFVVAARKSIAGRKKTGGGGISL
jgi:hypothetical protein